MEQFYFSVDVAARGIRHCTMDLDCAHAIPGDVAVDKETRARRAVTQQ